jgi:hypothetical protein
MILKDAATEPGLSGLPEPAAGQEAIAVSPGR